MQGAAYVHEYVPMSLGQHAVMVILPSGDTLRGNAWIDDSPDFMLVGRCKTFWYPTRDGPLADSVLKSR